MYIFAVLFVLSCFMYVPCNGLISCSRSSNKGLQNRLRNSENGMCWAVMTCTAIQLGSYGLYKVTTKTSAGIVGFPIDMLNKNPWMQLCSFTTEPDCFFLNICQCRVCIMISAPNANVQDFKKNFLNTWHLTFIMSYCNKQLSFLGFVISTIKCITQLNLP
jgi:hypothetical protein